MSGPTTPRSSRRRQCGRGDYAVEVAGEVVGVIECKKLAELAGNVVDGSLLVTLGELATATRAAIVVEDRWADVFRLTYVAPSMVAEMLAAAQIRYTNVPVVFCENRALAQEWAYRSARPLRTPTKRPSTSVEGLPIAVRETNVYRFDLTK